MATNGKILVTGATGSIGSVLIENLTKAGASVRALVRDKSKGRALKDAGVELAIGDLSRPETLDAAFAGVSKVYLITPLNENQYELASNGLAAAKRSGKPHVVRSSGMIPEPFEESRVGRHQVQIENDLKSSGLPYTILKPHLFMQTTMIAAQTVKSEGAIYMPLKEGKIAMIDVRDVAAAAAEVLTSEGHEGKTYELTGPVAISFHDVAAALSEALGKPVKYVDVPPKAAKEFLLGMGSQSGSWAQISSSSRNSAREVVTRSPETLKSSPGTPLVRTRSSRRTSLASLQVANRHRPRRTQDGHGSRLLDPVR